MTAPRLPQPKGWFVYCYLRTASNLPYYIGLGSRPDRMTARHCCKVPRDWSRIRVMRQGLTRDEAIHWERFYIARYGRRDLGAGVLINRTDGGEYNFNHGPLTREKIRQAALKPENVERLRTMNIGRKMHPKTKAALLKASTGRPMSDKARRALAEANRRPKPPAQVEKMCQTKLIQGAAKVGVCPLLWAVASSADRKAVKRRLSGGVAATAALAWRWR